MTKSEWIQICKLNQEWYFRSVMSNPSEEWIKEHMPDDSVFDDGRIEFFEKRFETDENCFNKYQEEIINRASSWILDFIVPADIDGVDMVDESNPEVFSYIKETQKRLEKAQEIVKEFKNFMYKRD